MENLKLISVRLERNTLDAIDEFAKQQRHFTRSWVINNLLANCVNCATSNDFWRMATTYQAEKKGYKLTFRVDPESVHNPHKTDY